MTQPRGTKVRDAIAARRNKDMLVKATFQNLRQQLETTKSLHQNLTILFDKPGVTPLRADYNIATAAEMMGPAIEQLEEAIERFLKEYPQIDFYN